MANHGYMIARHKLNPNKIQNILEGLNARIFKRKLDIERGEEGDYWTIRYNKDGYEYVYRSCWISDDKPTQFEMRHGGGSAFAWWVDACILNELAVQFNGTVTDDGIPDRDKGVKGKYYSFPKYINSSSYLTEQLQRGYFKYPPEFLSKKQRLFLELQND